LVKTDGLIIYDQDLVQIEKEDVTRSVSIPATKIALDLGNKIMANIVMLGALIAATNSVNPESLRTALRIQFPRYVEVNLKAFEEGVRRVEHH
jgi:2-oxoglutarate ferredoxin oxidoreductase subunit gamma